MRAIALMLIALAAASAVEVAATVTRVSDGDTIAVTLADGAEAKVRLLSIDTAESHDNSHGAEMPEGKLAAEYLRNLIPKDSAVILWGPGEKLAVDAYQRLLAFVVLPNGKGSVQEAIVKAGWSAYWRKYGPAPAPYDDLLIKAMAAAKEAKAGAWATAEKWMIDKANERTAPRRHDGLSAP